MARGGLRSGIRWRLHGLRQDVAATRLALRLEPARVPGLVARWGRRPTTNGPRYLHKYGAAALQDVVAACERGGVRPFLTFGTLLGHVREGGFIPHDFDVDLGVLEEEWEALAAVTEDLGRGGYRVARPRPSHCTVSHRRHAHVPVDLFLFARAGGARVSHAYSGRGRHDYHFPTLLVEPLRAGMTAWGFRAWLPARPEAFLAHHYGPDWRTPRPRWDYRTDATSAL